MALQGNYPTSLDTKTTYAGTDKVSTIDHANVLTKMENAIVDLETKVGVDGSAVTSTHDYKLSSVADGEKVVAQSGNQTIAGNKTFTGVTTTNGLEAGSGDINTTGNINAGAGTISTTGNVNGANIALNTAKVSADGSIDTHSDVDTTGKTNGQVLTFNSGSGNWVAGDLPETVESAPDSFRFVQGYANKFDFSVFTDDLTVKYNTTTSNNLQIFTNTEYREFLIASEIGGAGFDYILGVSFNQGNIYVLTWKSTATQNIRLSRINGYNDNLASATIDTIDVTTNTVLSGSLGNSNARMTMDKDLNFYFTGLSGITTSIRKSALVGNILQAETDILLTGTITSPSYYGCAVDINGDIIVTNTTEDYERYNQSGVSQKYLTVYFTNSYNYIISYYDGLKVNLYTATAAQETDPSFNFKIV